MKNNEWDSYHMYLIEHQISYFQYLRSEHWKIIKRRFYKRLNFKNQCEACKSRRKLNVHHKTYERIGMERLSDLCLLCRSCHKRVHLEHSLNNLTLGATTEQFIKSGGKLRFHLKNLVANFLRQFCHCI